MPVITNITEQKSRENRRNIFLDGKFAFGVNLNVVAKFYLRVGMELTAEQVAQIEAGEVRQECFDAATQLLGRRLHSRCGLGRGCSRGRLCECLQRGREQGSAHGSGSHFV